MRWRLFWEGLMRLAVVGASLAYAVTGDSEWLPLAILTQLFAMDTKSTAPSRGREGGTDGG